LQNRLNEFQRSLKEKCPTPTLRPRGPQRAIDLYKVMDLRNFFSSFVRDRTAYYLSSNILRPLTQTESVSYAELAGASQVQFFVSHFWGTPFVQFCDAISKHAQTCDDGNLSRTQTTVATSGWLKTAYWICFCSNNQYQIEAELGYGDWEQSAFYITLRSGFVKGTCLVLDDQALPLTRSWCIFELLQTLMLERDDEKKIEFEGLLLCTSSGCLNSGMGSVDAAVAVVEKVASLDLAQAQASNPDDAEMIKRQVLEQMGSFDKMHNFVREDILKIIKKTRTCANVKFDELFDSLQCPDTSLSTPHDEEARPTEAKLIVKL